jgi:hypothetical protein
MDELLRQTLDDELRMHVLPLSDLREHEVSLECWCGPVEDDGVVVHNALDGREAYERGERRPV